MIVLLLHLHMWRLRHRKLKYLLTDTQLVGEGRWLLTRRGPGLERSALASLSVWLLILCRRDFTA